MNNNKNKSIERLKNALPGNTPAVDICNDNLLEKICLIFMENQNPGKRDKLIRKCVAQYKELTELISSNNELLTASIEQALLRLSTGYYVTETIVKNTPRGKYSETKRRYIQPNPKAVEFFLANRKPDVYGESKGDKESGLADEILEALKDVK